MMNRKFCRALAWMLGLILLVAASAAAEVSDLNARFRGVPTLELDGETYRLNRRITTVLLMGVDQTASQLAEASYRSGGQADFLVLLIVDDAQRRISAIQINRDTMVELTTLNVLGEAIGTRTGQICLAYGFGDGGARSCELVCDAVRALLNDTPIDYYVAMNLDGIPALNDALGGVEVALEDDFTAFDPEMTAGRTMVLRGKQAEYFVRMRYNVGDETNLSRLKRQRSYMRAAASAFHAHVTADSGYARTLFAQLEPYLVSNISRGALYNIAEKASRYEIGQICEIAGETRLGEDGFMTFYPDADALARTIATELYEKVS